MAKGVTVWFTGLSGSGKTTIASGVHDALRRRHILSERLDGDVVRQSLCRDLGFSREDREKNIDRVTFVSKVLTRNGVIVLSCFISPYRRMRDNARHEIEDFLEVYVRTPLEVLISRDVKGMYKRALAGEIQNFTGVNDPYEEPLSPELVLDTATESTSESIGRVLRLLEDRGYVPQETVLSPSASVVVSDGLPGPGAPHGGVLIDRALKGSARSEALARAKALPKFGLDERELTDLELIGCGALSPLTGFMREADYITVVDAMRLTDGLVWAMPVNLATSSDRAKDLTLGQEIALTDKAGKILAVMTVTDMWRPDKVRETTACFGTTDASHPGVARVLSQGDVYLGGPVWMIDQPTYEHFGPYRMTPRETRAKFDAFGWRRVVAFHADEPLSRGAEYLQKVALELVDGLLLHTLVSATRPDDGSALRVLTAEALLEHYFPKRRAMMSILPAVPRHAGTRERLWYAIVAKNYGCTHVIWTAPATGTGDADSPHMPSLGDTDAAGELGITPLLFARTFFCTTCGTVATTRTCPHDPSHHLLPEGAHWSDLPRDGDLPRAEYFRPELARIMMTATGAQPTPDAADSR